MNRYEKLFFIKQYTDSIGPIYGTEDFSIFLYSLIKMRKPKTVVELGTGLGSIALWAGLALEENASGIFYTVDNGAEWNHLKQARPQMGSMFREQYLEYVNNLIDKFELTEYIKFIHRDISVRELPDRLDIVFSDFSHGPIDILSLLSELLPKMSNTSIIMFDSASTYYSSYHTLEAIVDMFNAGKVPASMKNKELIQQLVSASRFKVQHVVEAKDRAQNSTACLYIEPVDIFPYPISNMRFK
jgi:predicted O-methyltransferase YrrM